MKNVLKVSLTKNQQYKYSNIYDAQVLDNHNITITDIVDEMIEEGVGIDKKTVLDIIARFNQKSANLALSGKKVDTGLVILAPIIKGALNEKKWSLKANKVEVSITAGADLTNAMLETNVEIMDEKSDIIEIFDLSRQVNQPEESNNKVRENVDFDNSKLRMPDDPACGIAFRTWLWKS